MARLFPENSFVPSKLGSGDVLVVAEAPGFEESIQGEPLIGSAGKWFDAISRKAGLKRDELTLTNCISCRPPDNVFPTDPNARSYISEADARKAVDQCAKNYLWPLVNGRPWTKIISLGDKALRELTDKEGIFTWRGSPLPLKGREKTCVIPTIHPAAIARDQSFLPAVINDLKKNPQPPPEFYNLTPSLEDVQAFTATEFGFDLETKWGTQEITMIGLSDKATRAIVVPFHNPYIAEIRRIFKNATVLYAHNGVGFDMEILMPALGLEWNQSFQS